MDSKSIPKCIGIIMDGNRRYAKEQGKSQFEGHELGYRKLKEVVGWAKDVGVQYVIAYAFSTENWKRSPLEVDYLMNLFRKVLKEEIDVLKKEGVSVRFIGDLKRFPKDIQDEAHKAEDVTTGNLILAIALSYGGRTEIVDAVKKISQTLSTEEIENITEADFETYITTKGIPDPELIIRTGGEMRLSNFLPWQSIYSELFFTPTKWPALSKDEFLGILKNYALREKRYGA